MIRPAAAPGAEQIVLERHKRSPNRDETTLNNLKWLV